MNDFKGLSSGGVQETFYVLKWKCEHCKTEGASFVDGVCTNCANPFDEQEIDQISEDDIQKTTDPKVIHEIRDMIGWFCSSCSSYNRNLTRENYEAHDFENCNCKSCGNELNEKEDGDYIMLDGPPASTPAGAVRALIERNIETKRKIAAKKVGRIIDQNGDAVRPPRLPSGISTLRQEKRDKITSILEQQKPYKWYWGAGAGATLIVAFLAYKGLEEKDVVIHIDGFEWSRNIALESVQRLSKSDWAEDVDGSIYQTDAFYNFLEEKRYYRSTGREYNHNPAYCYTTPSSETYIDYRQECTTRTTYSQSCTGTSGGGVSCRSVPSTQTDCRSIPETKVRYYNAESCKYVDFQINDWAPGRNLPTGGKNQDNPTPYWQEYTLKGDGYSLGSERESRRSEKYIITVSYNQGKDTDILELPQSTWESLSIASECSAKASFILGVNIDTVDWSQCQ